MRSRQPSRLRQDLRVGEVRGFVRHLERRGDDRPARGAQAGDARAGPRRSRHPPQGARHAATAADGERAAGTSGGRLTDRQWRSTSGASRRAAGERGTARRRSAGCPRRPCAARPSHLRIVHDASTAPAPSGPAGSAHAQRPAGARPRPMRRAIDPANDHHEPEAGRRYSIRILPVDSPGAGCGAPVRRAESISSTARSTAKQSWASRSVRGTRVIGTVVTLPSGPLACIPELIVCASEPSVCVPGPSSACPQAPSRSPAV